MTRLCTGLGMVVNLHGDLKSGMPSNEEGARNVNRQSLL
jgi:hypothetical protein